MYKEIPDDTVAREAMSPLTNSPDESLTTQVLPTSGQLEAAVRSELAEWKERCLRLAADFENFKKRTAKENERRAAEQKNAFVRDLLPVADNLERALANDPTHLPAGQLREGVLLTHRQLIQVLNQHGFVSRDDLGRSFDPQFHEAVCVRSEPMLTDHTVLEVWNRGWLRGKELFRPAKVVVNDHSCGNATGHRENFNHEQEQTITNAGG